MSQNDIKIAKTRIDLKMTPKQKQSLQLAAKASNMSLSAFVLNSASKAAELLLESQPATAVASKVSSLPTFTKPACERWFQEFLKEEFKKYQSGQAFDPLAICATTRRSVEAQAYKQIQHLPEAKDFFNVHKTSPKLDWATQRGRDNTIPIVAKLGNPIIKKLIIELVSKCLTDGDVRGAPA